MVSIKKTVLYSGLFLVFLSGNAFAETRLEAQANRNLDSNTDVLTEKMNQDLEYIIRMRMEYANRSVENVKLIENGQNLSKEDVESSMNPS